MRDEDVQREIDRAVENKTTTGWRKRQIARNDDDDIQEYVRPWVGLTEAQCGVLWKTNMTPFEYYQAIETKLREKNHG